MYRLFVDADSRLVKGRSVSVEEASELLLFGSYSLLPDGNGKLSALGVSERPRSSDLAVLEVHGAGLDDGDALLGNLLDASHLAVWVKIKAYKAG